MRSNNNLETEKIIRRLKSVKKNPFIFMSITDSGNTQYLKCSENGAKFPFNIPEFIERVGMMAYGCEIIVDENFIRSNNFLPPTQKTTIVLCDNPSTFKDEVVENQSRTVARYITFINKRSILSYIIDHEIRRKTPLYFILSQDTQDRFLGIKSRYIYDTLELCVSDRKSNGNVLSNIESTVDGFYKHRIETFGTDVSDKENERQQKVDTANKGRKETILNGSMKIVETFKKEDTEGCGYVFKRYSK
ncbi:hypothetical protein BPT24_004 [Tenacibaculum phage pT24]|uniref:Uncharacterized protein n=1 Tax=Tenacibaculum phage pT24 TaxID=1880590 RepID=A0A1W7GKN1_9CAUD|nr:hypothetical protein HYP10_gp004 [Tenacibaculum phage pT24]BAX25545.1 hypothetical protein BPT24_004 [Tenacibaculum phage pT24]